MMPVINEEYLRKTVGSVLLVIIATGLIFIPGLSLQAEAAQAKDKRGVALETLSRVIEGLKKVREFLSGKEIPAEVLAAIDTAVKNLESTIEILKETGDVKAAEVALKSSSAKAGNATKVEEKEERGEEARRLQESIRKAIERAEEIAGEVSKLVNISMRQGLETEVKGAKNLLEKSMEVARKGETAEAARLLGDATKILGSVNSEVAKVRMEEKVARTKGKLQETIEKRISEIRKDITDLKKRLLEKTVPGEISEKLLSELEEASKLLDEADANSKKGELNSFISNLGRAQGVLNRVKASMKTAEKATEGLLEKTKEVEATLSELRAEVKEKSLPSETVAKINELLESGASLLKEAKESMAKGDFGNAKARLARAETSLRQAESLLKKGERGRLESKDLEVEAEVEEGTLEVEIENNGNQAVSIRSVKVLDSKGKEVNVSWSKECKVTVEEGKEIKCKGKGDFQSGETYKVILEVKRADESQTSILELSVKAEDRKETERKEEGKRANGKLTENIQRRMEEVRKEIAELREKISKVSLPANLSKDFSERLDEAAKLLDGAEAAAKKGETESALSNIGKAQASVNQVRSKFDTASKEIENLSKDITKTEERVEEIRKEVKEKGISGERAAKVNELLESAASLIKEAKESMAKGDFGQAKAQVAKARAAIEQAESLLKAGEKERDREKTDIEGFKAEVTIKGKSIELRLRSESAQLANVTSIKVMDAAGKEVRVEWKTDCKVKLQKGDEAKCAGTGDFQPGQTYSVVMGLRLADGSVKELKLISEAKTGEERIGKEDKQLETSAEIKGKSLKVGIKNESDEKIEIVSVKVYDKEGKEVKVQWASECKGSLGRGEGFKCTGEGEFARDETYRVVIEAMRGDGSTLKVEMAAEVGDRKDKEKD